MKKILLLMVMLMMSIFLVSAFNFGDRVNAYFKLDESSGNAIDSTGNFTMTNVNSPTQSITGIINTAYNLTKTSSQYISNQSRMNITGYPYSFQAWVRKPNITEPTEQTIMGFGNTAGGGDNQMSIGINNAGFLYILARITGASDTDASLYKINDSTFHHIVVVFKATGASVGDRKIYLDGNNIFNSTGIVGVAFNLTTDTHFYIGATAGGSPGNFFNGTIDEVGLFSRELSLTDVRELYNNGSGLAFSGVTLNAPSDNASLILGINNTFNCSALGTNLLNLSLLINGTVNYTVYNTTASQGNLSLAQNVSFGTAGGYNWSCQSYGDANITSSTRTFSVNEFAINSIVYNTNTYEGAVETFTLNSFISSARQVSTAYLVYNGTSYLGTVSAPSNNTVNITRVIPIPDVNSVTNISFFWNITLDNGANYISTTNHQIVSTIGIDNCSIFSTVIYNLTMKDEGTQLKLNGTSENTTIEVDLDVYSSDRTLKLIDFSANYTKTNPVAICLNGTINGTNQYSLDGQFRYGATNYAKEFYNIQNFTLRNSSIPQNITLYDLPLTSSTEFLITFKNTNFLPVPNALIEITRKYVSEGVFKTVEIPMTDSEGDAVAHLDLDSVIYTIIVSQNGTTLATFNNVAVRCEDETTGNCKITLNAFSSGTEFSQMGTLGNITYLMTFDQSSRIVTVVFSTTTGGVKNVSLISLNSLGNTTLCSNALTSSAGTLTCSIPSSIGNATFTSFLRSDGYLVVSRTFSISERAESIFGDKTGLLLTALLLLTLPLLFVGNGIVMLVIVIVSLILAGALGFINLGSVTGITSIVLWFIIAIVIIIYKMSRREDGV